VLNPYTARMTIMLRIALFLACLLAAATGGVADEAVDPSSGTVRLALSGEPPSLDSIRATDQLSFFVLAHLMEGLLRYDAQNRLAPALAERWELREDGATFWLRRGALWENGAQVVAGDFVHAWREVLRPSNAAPYASLLYPLRNARAIAAGGMPVESLGVTAPEDFRLELAFAEPCAWFPALTAFMTLLPLQPAFHAAQGERHAADAGRILANGPYRLARWVHGAELVLERNPRYRDAQAVRIRRIEIPYITTDAQAELNLFLDRRIAIANIAPESVRQALVERLRLRRFADGYVHFLGFNFRDGRVTRSLALRRAIQAALDPGYIVDRVLRMPGLRPAESLFPSVLSGATRALIDEFPLAPPPRGEELARRELAGALTELGVLELPPLHLLTGEAPTALRIGEYVQARLAEVLGIRVRLDRQITKQRLQQMNRGEFDIALQNWGPDFDDPITFAELLVSGNPVNRGRYASAAYDRWVRAAGRALEPSGRLAAFDAMQRLVRDDAPLIPLYENARLYVQHPALHGVVRAPFSGDPDLRHAWIADP
jgi:oligopeptide transport system substrate-binding protein